MGRRRARANGVACGSRARRPPHARHARAGRARRGLLLALVAVVVALSFLVRRTGVGPGGGPAGPAFDPADYQDVPVVEAGEAGALVGEQAVVCGRVVNAVFASATGGQPTFLNLERAYPEQPFDVVVWGRDRDRFDPPPEEAYPGRRICAAGRVGAHEGAPRIEAREPGQIRVVPE